MRQYNTVFVSEENEKNKRKKAKVRFRKGEDDENGGDFHEFFSFSTHKF